MKSANDYNMSMVQVAHLDGIRLVARRSMFTQRCIISADWHVKCLPESLTAELAAVQAAECHHPSHHQLMRDRNDEI
jgi:hypothetical protein